MLNSTDKTQAVYGVQDGSYQAAGREEGLRQLCTDFYLLMDTLPEAKTIPYVTAKFETKSADN